MMHSPFEHEALAKAGIAPLNPKTPEAYRKLAREAEAKARGIKPPEERRRPAPLELEKSQTKQLGAQGVADIEKQAAASRRQKSGLEIDDADMYLNPAQARAYAEKARKAEGIRGGESIPLETARQSSNVRRAEALQGRGRNMPSGLELDPERKLLSPDEVIKYQEREYATQEKSRSAPPPAKAEKREAVESLGALLLKRFAIVYADVRQLGKDQATNLRGYSVEDVQGDLIEQIKKEYLSNHRNPRIDDMEKHLKNILMPATIAARINAYAGQKDRYAKAYADLLDLATERLLRKSIETRDKAA